MPLIPIPNNNDCTASLNVFARLGFTITPASPQFADAAAIALLSNWQALLTPDTVQLSPQITDFASPITEATKFGTAGGIDVKDGIPQVVNMDIPTVMTFTLKNVTPALAAAIRELAESRDASGNCIDLSVYFFTRGSKVVAELYDGDILPFRIAPKTLSITPLNIGNLATELSMYSCSMTVLSRGTRAERWDANLSQYALEFNPLDETIFKN